MVYVVGVFAALLLGVGYVLQQRVAATAPQSTVLRFRLLLDLMRRPLWWGGIGAMVVGELLAGLALQLATVAVVEPLLSTSLLFALGLAAALSRHRIRWQEAVGALLLSAALGVFIAVGDPRSSPAPEPNNAVITVAVAAVGILALVLTTIGKRSGAKVEAILLATAAGVLYGLQDVCTRAALLLADHQGVLTLLVSAWTYILLAAAVFGLLLSQSAFEVARLDYSLPPIAAAEPITGITLGVTLLGDVTSVSVLGLAVEAVCVVAVVAAILLIGRSPNLAGFAVPPADGEG